MWSFGAISANEVKLVKRKLPKSAHRSKHTPRNMFDVERTSRVYLLIMFAAYEFQRQNTVLRLVVLKCNQPGGLILLVQSGYAIL